MLFDENGQSAEAPEAILDGWTFKDWKDADGSSFSPLSIYDGAVFYAEWVDDIAPRLTLEVSSDTADKQTVVLTMQDDGSGMDSFYVGKADPATDEAQFLATDQESAIVEIDEEGTWYFAAKDKDGNVIRQPLIFYKIKLEADGGAVEPDTIIAAKDTEIELPIPQKTGYTFVEWQEQPVQEGIPDVPVTGNKSFKATYQKNRYKVIFDANGGSCDTPYMEVEYDSSVGTLPNATRAGYALEGWYTAPADGIKISPESLYQTVGDITVYAHWQPANFTINHYELNENGEYSLIETEYMVGDAGTTMDIDTLAKDYPGYTYVDGNYVTNNFTGGTDLIDDAPSGATIMNSYAREITTKTAATVYINQDGFYKITVAGSPGQYAWAKHLCPDVCEGSSHNPATYYGGSGGSGAVYTGIAYIKAGTTLKLNPNGIGGGVGQYYRQGAANSSNATAGGYPDAFLEGSAGHGGSGSEIYIVGDDNSDVKIMSAVGGTGASYKADDGFSCSYLLDGYSWTRIWVPYLAGGAGGGSDYLAPDTVIESATDKFQWVTGKTTLQNSAIVGLDSSTYTNGYASVEYMSSVVIIDPNGGLYCDSAEATSLEIASGQTVTLQTPTYEGHIFRNWAIVEGEGCSINGNQITMGASTVYIKAIWDDVSGTIVVDPDYKYIINLYYKANSYDITSQS
ncbi:MAG: InlB B-repeat-containing protein [Agathobacter sp.]